MKKLVIFDLDGTLLNTIADLANSTNHALKKLGYPIHKIEEYNFMVELTSSLSVPCRKEKKQKKMYSVYVRNSYPITTNTMQTRANHIPEFPPY